MPKKIKAPVFHEFAFPSADGRTAIHAVEWLPEGPPRGVVQLSHGISEYILCYREFAQWLAARGFAVAGHDHLGHGTSLVPGRPRLSLGPSGNWFVMAEDLAARRRLALERFPGVPCFLLGHSMGSFLARTDLILHPGAADGAILLGTGWLPAPAAALARALASFESRRLGNDAVSPFVARLTRGMFAQNPLCGGPPPMGLLRELLDRLVFIQRPESLRRMDPNAALLLASGGRDPVGGFGLGVRRTAKRLRRAGVRDVNCQIYPGRSHEILMEAGREDVYRALLAWMESRL